MKKIFTLIAVALMALNVNAQTNFEANPEGLNPVPAGTVLTDNEFFKATTVFEAGGGSNTRTYTNDITFNNWISLRVDKDPSADNPYGIEKSGSTSIIIDVKKNITFTTHVRTGNNKEVCLFDVATSTKVSGTSAYLQDETSEGNYFWSNTWTLEAGKQYVVTERGGTGQLAGFTAVAATTEEPGTGGEGTGGEATGEMTPFFTWEAGTAVGGTVVGNGSDAESVGTTDSDYTVIKVSAKKANIATDNVTITFDQALEANDQIQITAYRKKDTDANGTLCMVFENSYTIDEGDNVVWNNIHEAIGQQPNTNTYTVGQGAGSKTITLARSKASTNVFIIKFVVARATAAGINNVETITNVNAPVYNISGQQVDKNYKGIVIMNGKKYINK